MNKWNAIQHNQGTAAIVLYVLIPSYVQSRHPLPRRLLSCKQVNQAPFQFPGLPLSLQLKENSASDLPYIPSYDNRNSWSKLSKIFPGLLSRLPNPHLFCIVLNFANWDLLLMSTGVYAYSLPCLLSICPGFWHAGQKSSMHGLSLFWCIASRSSSCLSWPFTVNHPSSDLQALGNHPLRFSNPEIIRNFFLCTLSFCLLLAVFTPFCEVYTALLGH